MRTVKFKDNLFTLVGRTLKEGRFAPDFRVVSSELEEIRLVNFKNKIKIITSFPSLDTSVCDLQVKEFNRKASNFSSDIVILGISKDLPFAQKRFCEANNIKNLVILSDYKYSSFGINYGLLIKELNLLTRAVIILDKYEIIRYIQIVEELTSPPTYEDVLRNLEEVLKNPLISAEEQLPSKCKPCEGGYLLYLKKR
ncbi:MAG: thiol peroxidase [Candidatus Omnitrophica bacterium]|nr:thiol peroxidase [Candidatus Omnitrophota bacterium]